MPLRPDIACQAKPAKRNSEGRPDSLLEIHFQSVDQVLGGASLFICGFTVLIEHMVTDMAIDNFGH